MHRMVVAGLLLGVAACTAPSMFVGRINDAFFEPTGTVFGFTDALTPAPALATRTPGSFFLVGVYPFFDAAQDQGGQSGTQQADLRKELEENDWIAMRWDDVAALANGATFTAVVLRDSGENIYRLTDPSATDATAGFNARVRFRREPVGRTSQYECAQPVFPPCRAYTPLGGRVRVQVTVRSVNRATAGTVAVEVKLDVEKVSGDPEDARTGSITGTLNASTVSERVGENNFRVLDLYSTFNLPE